MLDAIGLVTVTILFAMAAITPIGLLLMYRLTRINARLTEICKIMDQAFGKSVPKDAPPAMTREEKERRRARRALDDNPYISDLFVTFDDCHAWRQYFLPLVLLGILTIGISVVVYVWVRMQLTPGWRGGPIAALPLPIVMALAGGYVWSLYQIVMRVRSDEMGPGDLIELSLGLISCVPIGYAMSLITPDAGTLRSLVAFSVSAFPMRELQRFLQEQTMKRAFAADLPARSQRPTERHLGTAIEGVSDQALVRLAELRVVTVLEMAYSDPIRIMVNTGYPLPLVVDWIDQSVLALYTGEKRAELTKMGLRCSLDVYEFVEQHHLWTVDPNDPDDPDKGSRGTLMGDDADALRIVAAKLDVDKQLVHDLFLRIYSDPQVVVLRRLWYVNGAPAPVRTGTAPIVVTPAIPVTPITAQIPEVANPQVPSGPAN